MQYYIKRWLTYITLVIALVVGSLSLSGCNLEASIPNMGAANHTTATQSNDSLSGTLDVYTLDIGQGDSHLIKVGDDYTLIDTGDVDHRDRLIALLKQYNVSSLKNVIITHPHADHMGGFYALIKAGIPIGHVYDNGMEGSTSVYKTYLKNINKKQIPHSALYKGAVVDLGHGATFTVYAPEEGKYLLDNKGKPDPNDNSIVGKLTFGKFSMLFTGDASRAEENRLIKEENTKLASRVLKVGHHGSSSSSQKDFIRSVRPELAVISVGLHNDYGHPTSQALKRLAEEKVLVYRTDTQGTIRIHTDGNTWSVTTER